MLLSEGNNMWAITLHSYIRTLCTLWRVKDASCSVQTAENILIVPTMLPMWVTATQRRVVPSLEYLKPKRCKARIVSCEHVSVPRFLQLLLPRLEANTTDTICFYLTGCQSGGLPIGDFEY